MNAEQIKSILQLLLAAGGPLSSLLLSYGVSADKMTLWVNLALAILPPLGAGIWALIERTHKNQIAAVAANPGVAQIVVKDGAGDGAKAAAEDPKLDNVVKASQT